MKTKKLFSGIPENPRPASAFAVALLGLALVLAGCGRSTEERAKGHEAGEPHVHAAEAIFSRVELAPKGLETAGLEYGTVVRGTSVEPLRFPAEVGYNLKSVASPAARASGRVEKVTAFPGDRVTAGQTLMLIYSPDFLALQAELLQAVRQAAGTEGQAAAARRETWRPILEAARNRLRQLDLNESEIEAIERSGRAESLLPVKSSVAGTVIESLAAPGAYVEAGAPLLRLSDLSTVWLEVRIFESDLARVREGMAVEVRAAAFPDEPFSGKLVLLRGELDTVTRTVAGRVEVRNIGGRLRPGMFCEAVLRPDAPSLSLFVPAAAVHPLDGRTIVFVPLGETVFEVRHIVKGRSVNGMVEVLVGLREGDRVVTRGSFLLKSELLKAALGEEGHHHD